MARALFGVMTVGKTKIRGERGRLCMDQGEGGCVCARYLKGTGSV